MLLKERMLNMYGPCVTFFPPHLEVFEVKSVPMLQTKPNLIEPPNYHLITPQTAYDEVQTCILYTHLRVAHFRVG